MNQNTASDVELLKNVMHSTESALAALSQLEQSLVRGRFKEGIVPYEVMCKTLVGQRIWTSDKNDGRINSNFGKISVVARNIIDILAPYIDNLKKIAMLDGEMTFERGDVSETVGPLDGSGGKVVQPVQDEEMVLDALKKSPKNQMSYTKLRSMFGWDRKRVEDVLAAIAGKSGAISVTTTGSRKMITLK